MLNFEDTFTEGHEITDSDVPTLMQCINIKYSHTEWTYDIYRNIKIVQHVVDNIVDINDIEYGYINKNTISNINNINICCGPLLQSSMVTPKTRTVGKFVDYLTDVSLDKFTGFYNVEKYHYMINTMLLIIKKQQRLPPAIVKHLIIPFIYQ